LDEGLREECANNTCLNIVRDKDSREPGLQADRMSEAEVALHLADFILSLPPSGAMASVAIDGARIKAGTRGLAPTGAVTRPSGFTRGQVRAT
jgi:hypothetical protein